MTTGCPFCHTSIRKSVFDESPNFLAIYNLAPIFPGHSLIIPKKHLKSVDELSDVELSEMTLFARKTTRLLQKVFKAESFNWSLQDKEHAGQTQAHLHLHIVLRFPGDLPEPGDWYPRVQQNTQEILDSESREKLSPEEINRIVLKIKKLKYMRIRSKKLNRKKRS